MTQQNYTYIGKSIQRVDIEDKAFGIAKYTGDEQTDGLKTALVTSEQAHANLKR